MPNPDLVERLDRLPRVRLAATTYRHVSTGRQPLSGEGARILGGRWNPPESFPTLYLAKSVDTAVREFYRLAERNARAVGDFLPRELYRIEVALSRVLDLSQSSAVSAAGIQQSVLLSDDLSVSQAVADAAHYLDFEAVQAPSATGAGIAVAVFTDRLDPTSQLVPQLHDAWETPPRPPPNDEAECGQSR
jgi:RES domain-containing protein